MKRILLIKLTSLGDLIHALPALSDALAADPEIQFDWAIDENFHEIATWHPAVKNIFTTNHRKWRKGFATLATHRSLFSFLKGMRKTKYDLVIDGQGNFKTGLLSLLARGMRAGYDRHSVRESIASFAYQKKYPASKQAHAVDRLRQLFALAIGYPVPLTPPDFQILRERFVKPKCALPESYLVFVHNASWETKLWPESFWEELIKKAAHEGHQIVLPWGNAKEKARAERLAAHSEQVTVLPRVSLSEMGYVLARAKACVCMDTGLSHLTAALNTPSVTLYGSTDSGLIGASGNNQKHLQSKLSCAPCNKKKCRFPSTSLNPPCLAQLTPETVYQQLKQIL